MFINSFILVLLMSEHSCKILTINPLAFTRFKENEVAIYAFSDNPDENDHSQFRYCQIYKIIEKDDKVLYCIELFNNIDRPFDPTDYNTDMITSGKRLQKFSISEEKLEGKLFYLAEERIKIANQR